MAKSGLVLKSLAALLKDGFTARDTHISFETLNYFRHNQGAKMKRLMIMFAAVAILAPACLWAQDPPKAEVFGGFSVLHTTAGDNDEGFTPVGWAASLAGNINPKMGVVADFAGNYKDGVKMHSYMGGLRYNHRMEKVTPFVHAMLGGTRVGDETSGMNGFSLGFGGGFDYSVNERINVRVLQFDWAPTRFSQGGISDWKNNIVRFGFGIVFKTGA